MRFYCLVLILLHSEWQICSSLAPDFYIVRSKLELIDEIIHSLLPLFGDVNVDVEILSKITNLPPPKITTIKRTTPPPTTTTPPPTTTTPPPTTTTPPPTTATPPPKTTSPPLKPKDCSDVKQYGIRKSGIYVIQPLNRVKEPRSFRVYCDMETDGGGWTVIQRRGNFGHPKDYFYKNWKSYSDGFGDVDKDFWLGNDKLHSLTNQGKYSIRVDLTDKEGSSRYAKYNNFKVDSESESYKLHVSGYSGTAGDSLYYHDNKKFSATDRDNDGDPNYSCVNTYKGGWWYNSSFCYYTNLNGFYATDSWQGVVWHPWRGWSYSLPRVEMKIRRE